MTSNSSCGKGGVGFTYVWKIENFAQCGIRKDEYLDSPRFTIPAVGAKEEWILRLYEVNRTDTFLHLDLKKMDGQLSNVIINCQICVCISKGEVLHENETESLNYVANGYYHNIAKLGRGIIKNLPDDILLIHFHLNGYDIGNNSNINCFARIKLQLHQRRIFYWKIENFSSLLLGEEKEYVLTSVNTGGPVLIFKLSLAGRTDDDASVQITLKYTNVRGTIFSSCVLYVMGVNGPLRKHYSRVQFWIDSIKNFKRFPHFLQRRDLVPEDIPEDTLTLRGEVTISENNNSVADVVYDGPNTQESAVAVAKPTGRSPSARDLTSSLSSDMQSLLSGSGPPFDFELRVQGRRFLVHQVVLGARSAVFRAMFTNDMLEREQGCLELTDVDADTVERLLQYVYADAHPPAELAFWPLAHLYAAADKYSLMGLRRICVRRLVQGLSSANVPDTLMLADQHRDQYLKEEVTEYVFGRGRMVLESEEWKDLERENPQLAAETLRRIICEKFLMASVESSEDSKDCEA